MDIEIQNKFEEQSKKLDEIYRITKQTRNYFFWIIIISVIAFVLPLIGLLFAIPKFLSTYSSLGF